MIRTAICIVINVKNISQKQNLTQTTISVIGLETLKIKDANNVKITISKKKTSKPRQKGFRQTYVRKMTWCDGSS